MARQRHKVRHSRWLMAAVLAVAGASGPWCTEAAESGPDTLKLEADGVTFEFVRVPAGAFLMGSEEGDTDEQPVHEVRIGREFYLGKTEITVGQFKAFCRASGYMPDAEVARWLNRQQREAALFRLWAEKGFSESHDHPAVCVRWHNAVAFCRWLSERTGRNTRLPSEAEWEYACRAGTTGAHAGDLEEMAWHAGNAEATTHAVGTRKPNAWGLYDMHGNVWEWCADTYHRHYDGAPVDGAPWTAGIDSRRIMRGGGWSERFGPPASPAVHLRSAYRYRLPPEYRDPAVGFRIVCEAEGVRNPVESRPQTALEVTRTNEKPAPSKDKAPLAFAVDSASFELVHVPPGEFEMGSETGRPCERPAHRMRIERGFDMARTEVTVWQFMVFTQATGYLTDVEKDGRAWNYRDGMWEGAGLDWFQPGFEQSGDNPAVCITWYDAVAFCQWLSQATGWEIRLPTEAEWEYACRAGTTGDHAGDIDALGWHGYNSGLRTHPVGAKKPNAWGLYDMHGNAWEWCQDNWHENYEGAPPTGVAWENAAHPDHVLRGGAWCRNPWVLRSAYRYHAWPDCPSVNMGFRVVRTCPGNCSSECQTDATCP